MRICCLVLFFLLAVTGLRAQGEPGLAKRLDAYFAATKAMDMDATLDLVYPRIFTFARREDMKKGMEQALNNPDMTMQLDSMVVDSMHRTLVYQGGRYARIDYTFLIRMHANSDSTGPVAAREMLGYMKRTYGAGNVRIDPVTHALVIRSHKTMLAIRNNYSKDWTFIEMQEKSGNLSRLFSQELITKLESY